MNFISSRYLSECEKNGDFHAGRCCSVVSSGGRRGGIAWKVLLAVFLLGAGVFVASLPRLIGSQWFYQPLVDRLAAGDFRVTIEGVSVGWFRPLSIEGIRVVDEAEPPLITIDRIVTDRSLLSLLFGGRSIHVGLIQPRVEFELFVEESKADRFFRALQGEFETTDDGLGDRPKPGWDVHLVLSDFQIVGKSKDEDGGVVISDERIEIDYLASTEGSPQVRIAPTRLMNEVELTPKLMQLGLEYALPVLSKSAWFRGRVSVDLDEIVIPLDEPRLAKGSGRVTLHEVVSGPRRAEILQAIDILARLRGREPSYEIVFVDGTEVSVEIEDAIVTHSGMAFGIPKVDPRLQIKTEGEVHLMDRSLALLVSFPVPVEQLAMRERVQGLGVPMLNLPVGGTLDQPEVDWRTLRSDSTGLISNVRGQLEGEAPVLSTLLRAMEGVADGQADETIRASVDFLREIRDRRQSIRAGNAESNANGDGGREASGADGGQRPRRPLRDALRGILQSDE